MRLGDSVVAGVIDKLSFEKTERGRRYINYRDLSVQQLGSIYERLLEHQVSRVDGEIRIQLNVFARKGSGSYYTPDDLVNLSSRKPSIRSFRRAWTPSSPRRGIEIERSVVTITRRDFGWP